MVVLSADTAPPHRGMTGDALEAAYQPSSRVAALQPYLDAMAERSAAERAAIEHRRVHYAEHPDEWMWYCPAADPGAPLFVFVHGGYWRRLSADDGTFASRHFHGLGAAVASLNYSLCPAAPLSTLVDQMQRAVSWLIDRAATLGHDPARIHVAGHSAGAHLAAMSLTEPGCRLAGAMMVSGVFDLTPIPLTSINEDVRLDDVEARRLSPLLRVGAESVPSIVAVAEHDTEEFKRQSLQWASTWAEVAGNRPPVTMEIADRNHFDVIFDLGDPLTPLGSAVMRQMGLG